MRKIVQLVSIGLFALVLVGCASPARIEQMTTKADAATIATVNQGPFKQNLALREVTGGRATNPLWVSNIGGAEFEKALEESLKSAGLLATSKDKGDYVLTADLIRVDQPLMGLDMTVSTTVRYTVVDRKTGKSIYAKDVTTPYTAKLGDAFIGPERLKLANEGAARQNIARFIEEVVQLKVAQIAVSK